MPEGSVPQKTAALRRRGETGLYEGVHQCRGGRSEGRPGVGNEVPGAFHRCAGTPEAPYGARREDLADGVLGDQRDTQACRDGPRDGTVGPEHHSGWIDAESVEQGLCGLPGS